MAKIGRSESPCGDHPVKQIRTWRSATRLWRTSLLVVLTLLLVPAAGHAHTGGTLRLSDAAAGPYRLYAWTQPEPLRVGQNHISVLVLNPGPTEGVAGEPVIDAQVEVRFETATPLGQVISVAALPTEFLGNTYYEADLELPTTGEWRVTISVQGRLGEGNAQFGSEVLPARTLNWVLIGSAGVGLLLLIGLMGLWSRLQGKAREPVTATNGVQRRRVKN